MVCRLSSKVDISSPEHRKDAINDLLDFHNETEGDFWQGYKKFLEEIENEMNKRLQPGYHQIKLCNANSVVDMISRLHKNPLG